MSNQKISELNSLTKATAADADVLAIVDTGSSETKKITYQELIQPQDNNFAIAGSSDNTKLVKFEVDGLTTATTRTLTIQDSDDTLVGRATTDTLTNKTLTSPVINVGSDAEGDLYYRNSGGTFTRLPIGTNTQILQVSASGLPEWIANPDTSDASETVKGVSEIATTAEIDAGTGTGGTGAKLVISPDNLASSIYTTTTDLDAVKTEVQTFTGSGTWTKPSGALYVKVQAWGGGGAGGGKDTTSSTFAGGGGGGAYAEAWFAPGDLSSTEAVTIGAGGTGSASSNGTAGGNTTFGSLLTAYGGGGGAANSGATAGGAGAGAGLYAVGGNGSAGAGAEGGAPIGGVAGVASTTETGDSLFGGGGGGDNTGAPYAEGGDSVNGGGGGGSNGQDGGKTYYGGGGGGGGNSSVSFGSGGTSVLGGAGGDGSITGAGAAGAVPGGGGGGAGSNNTTAYAGGNGGDGQIIVTTFR